jgi:hypothetical protein
VLSILNVSVEPRDDGVVFTSGQVERLLHEAKLRPLSSHLSSFMPDTPGSGVPRLWTRQAILAFAVAADLAESLQATALAGPAYARLMHHWSIRRPLVKPVLLRCGEGSWSIIEATDITMWLADPQLEVPVLLYRLGPVVEWVNALEPLE